MNYLELNQIMSGIYRACMDISQALIPNVFMNIKTRDERSTALSVSVSVNHMNYLYLYLYSDWAGPNPEVGGFNLEVGRVVLKWAGL